MQWQHKLVSGEANFDSIGMAIVPSGDDEYALWCVEQGKKRSYYINYEGNGAINGSGSAVKHALDAVIPYKDGYVTVVYVKGYAVLAGFSPAHEEVWRHSIKDADSLRWSMTQADDGKLYFHYSTCNPHDAHRQAHVAVLDPAEPDKLVTLTSLADDEFQHAQTIVSLPERLGLCVRNRGSHTAWHLIDLNGEAISGGSLLPHPHSKWGVPLCALPISGGDILLAGYREDSPGTRRPWVCRFDADFGALNGTLLPAEHSEQSVTALYPQGDGTFLALCPPWKIFRLSAKGFLTHAWTVPEDMRFNIVNAIWPAPDGGCFITGRARIEKEGSPAVWLARIGASDFTEV